MLVTVGLVMVARNEEPRIAATLERAKPLVSHWTLLDTGSTDRTVEAAREAMSGVPGNVFEELWQGFAHARTLALGLARGTADYLLMLDADHTLHVEGAQPELTADSYMLRVRGPLEWRLPLLTRSAHPFEYRGAAHAYLHSDAPTVTENLDWLSIDGGGGVTREKLERDRAALLEAHDEDPTDARSVFYLAQSCRDLGLVDEAVRYYRLRAGMNGFPEETYVARYELGCLLAEHVEFRQGARELLQAWEQRPARAEALRALANSANAVADKTPKPPDVLFVQPNAYRKEAA